MRAGRIVALVLGALLGVTGFGLVAAGAGLTIAHATQRDPAGYYMMSARHFQTPAAALATRVGLGSAANRWTPEHPLGTIRVSARAADGGAVFVGMGPADQVDSWLAAMGCQWLNGWRLDPSRSRMPMMPAGPGAGSPTVGPPAEQSFWTASASGTGTQVLTWPSRAGQWDVVVMNADGRAGVDVEARAGARTGALLPIGLGLGGLGLLVLLAGVFIVVVAVRGRASAQPVPTVVGAPGTYPVRLDGQLDERLNRWLWLVKWILLVPHVIVLGLLWLAVVPLTVVAGVAILCTGRYPRSIFDFNVGVLRWTWRVSFYGFSALGTDRYPPFSLDPDPSYPAEFTVAYPQRLSRGLVLVKWWFMALPHYFVVALFVGGWTGWFGRLRLTGGGSLIGILVLVAAVVLAVSGRYPRPLFDFVMGMNRWCYRVLAYALLMRDEYPPFRMDQGGTDPGSVPAPPAPPVPSVPPGPDRRGELAGAGSGGAPR